jgi:hypothetical protein
MALAMRHLVILLAVTLASCARTPRGQREPTRTPDTGGEAIEGSENQSDASRTRTRT